MLSEKWEEAVLPVACKAPTGIAKRTPVLIYEDVYEYCPLSVDKLMSTFYKTFDIVISVKIGVPLKNNDMKVALIFIYHCYSIQYIEHPYIIIFYFEIKIKF